MRRSNGAELGVTVAHYPTAGNRGELEVKETADRRNVLVILRSAPDDPSERRVMLPARKWLAFLRLAGQLQVVVDTPAEPVR